MLRAPKEENQSQQVLPKISPTRDGPPSRRKLNYPHPPSPAPGRSQEAVQAVQGLRGRTGTLSSFQDPGQVGSIRSKGKNSKIIKALDKWPRQDQRTPWTYIKTNHFRSVAIPKRCSVSVNQSNLAIKMLNLNSLFVIPADAMNWYTRSLLDSVLTAFTSFALG